IVAALAAEDPLQERSLRFHEDVEFTSVEEDSTATLGMAAVHQHDTRILFLFEGRAALGAAHPILFLLIFRCELGPFRFRLLAEFSDAFPVLLIEVLVLFAVALFFQVVFHGAFNLLHSTYCIQRNTPLKAPSTWRRKQNSQFQIPIRWELRI